MCIREMELMIIEEKVNPCERNEDIQGNVAMGPKGRMSHKAVRKHTMKACEKAEVQYI